MSHGFKQMKKVSRYVGECLKEGLLAFTQQQAVVSGTCRAVRWYGDGYGRGWMDDGAFELAFEQKGARWLPKFLTLPGHHAVCVDMPFLFY
jgi:hypothetical protein